MANDNAALALIVVLFSGFIVAAGASTPNTSTEYPQTILLENNFIQGENTLSYTIKAVHLNLCNIKAGSASYVADWLSRLQDLGVNTVRLWDGGEGSFGLNMVDHAGTWDVALETILTEITGLDRVGAGTPTGINKVYFQCLGDPWGGEFGIDGYHSGGSAPYGTPALVAEDTTRTSLVTGAEIANGYLATKAKIDALANSPTYGFNFLTDPRILTWSVSNEAYVGSGVGNVVYDWIEAITDYLVGLGADVTVNNPLYGTSGWNQEFHDTAPLFSGKGYEYLELHEYGIADLIHRYLGSHIYDWARWKTNLQATLSNQMADANAEGWTKDYVLLGEFGLPNGLSSEWASEMAAHGIDTFTVQNQVDYYTAYFQVLDDLYSSNEGWSWITPFHVFESTSFDYGFVAAPSNVPYQAYNVVKANFVSGPEPEDEVLPWTADFTDLTQFTVHQGSWSVAP